MRDETRQVKYHAIIREHGDSAEYDLPLPPLWGRVGQAHAKHPEALREVQNTLLVHSEGKHPKGTKAREETEEIAMAKQQQIFTENTEVPVEKSIGEIMGLLVRAGAVAINQELDQGHVVGLSFTIPWGSGRIPYVLPVRIEPVFKRLNGRRQRYGQATMAAKDREQAERVAWRQLFWWLKSQLALIDLGMVETAEVLMPYMLGPDGRSFFDTYKPRMLEAPKQTGAH